MFTLQAAHGKLQFVISRKTRPQTPDLIRHCNPLQYDDDDKSMSISDKLSSSRRSSFNEDINNNNNKEKTIIVTKVGRTT